MLFIDTAMHYSTHMEDPGGPRSCGLNESAAFLQIEPQAIAVELQTLPTAALGQPAPPSPSTLALGQKLCFSLFIPARRV